MAPEAYPTWRRVRDGRKPLASLLARERAIDGMRRFFKERGFHEVETPLLVRYPGMEPHLDVFRTELVTAGGQTRVGFLTTSPEYAMKKLLAGGLDRIFQICKAFRNHEDVSRRHNPEFTILEWYRTNADYRDLMDDCEALVRALAAGDTLPYQGEPIDLSPPWQRLSVAQAFATFAGVDLASDDLAAAARAKGYQVAVDTTWEQLFHQILLNEIEPRLGRPKPTFLYDYPASMAALARSKPSDPRLAERVELYIAGVELANGFSELLDADEQGRRLEIERKERQIAGRTQYDIDRDFLRALGSGIPPSAGIALGVDRLVMLLADVPSIRDVLWFPAEEVFELSDDQGESDG